VSPARRRRRSAAVLAGLAVGVLLAGCSTASSSPTTTTASSGATTTVPPGTTTSFTVGPYVAGTTTIVVHGDKTVVWYPAPRGSQGSRRRAGYRLTAWLPKALQLIVPKGFPDTVIEDAWAGLRFAPGRFPVVLFSHGTGGFPDQSSFLTTRLADWGFIVVAPDQTSRDLTAALEHRAKLRPRLDISQLEAALGAISALGNRPGDLFSGHVLNGAVGIVGHSTGGAIAVDMAEADPAIRVVVSLAGTSSVPLRRHDPVLFVAAGKDRAVPVSTVRRQYRQAAGPKALLVIDDAGHNVFDDICTVAHSRGGVVAAARHLKLPVPAALLSLASDGCRPPDVYPPVAWPLIDQATVAELRYGFGFDATPIGLGPKLDTEFPGVTASFVSSGP
jgi:predicted dienelactone hydrolase